MSEYQRAVFISYAWGEDTHEREAIVNQLDQSLQKRGLTIIRDKRDLGYKGMVRQFMERIGEGDCVIVVISDKYLRSKNCMYEWVEIAENKDFVNRVFPIVLADAKIYDAIDRINYKKYWQQKKEELNSEIRRLRDLSNIAGISEELNDYDRFGDEFDKLPTTLKNMNTLSPDALRDSDFRQLYDAIENRIGLGNQSRAKQSNVDATLNASGPIEEPPAQQTARYRVRVVAKTRLNVRSEPSISSTIVTQLNTDDVVEVLDEQQDNSGNVWACIGPNQWITIQAETAVRIPDAQDKSIDRAEETRRPDHPAARFEYRHKGVDLAVAYTSKGWRMENIDGLFVASIKFIMAAPIGSFFSAILDDIPRAEERTRLQDYLQNVADTLPEGENSVALPLPRELGQILLPFSRVGKAAIIAGETRAPQLIEDEAQRETYSQTVIQKSVVFAGVNGITHLVMPFIGDQTESHVESTIQTLLGINDFGSLKNITLVTIHAPMAVVARNRFELMNAQQRNWQENNRAEAVSNDRARGEDQLNIRGEVEALTDTLLLRDAEPPLAVGIIGGWGSGKSFVMHLIKERIKQTRAKAIKSGWSKSEEDSRSPNHATRAASAEVPAFAGHIYMIEFNAWTYAKSNLWASLMDTIFHTLSWQLEQENWLAHRDEFSEEETPSPEEIKISAEESMLAGGEIFKKIYEEGYQPDTKDNLTEKQITRLGNWSSKLLSKTLLWQAMRTQNEKTLENLRQNEKELADLKISRDMLEKKQADNEAYLAQIMTNKESKEAYNELLKSRLHNFFADTFGKSFEEALKQNNLDKSQVEDVKDLMQGYKGLFAAFRQNKYYVFAAIGVASISIALPILYDELFKKQWVDYGITWFTAIISMVAPVLQAIRTQARKVLEFEQETQQALENTYMAHRKREAEFILADSSKTTEEKISVLNEQANKGSLPAYDALIALREAQVEQQRQQLGPSVKYPTLLEFVQSRLNAATYENQLGLMHQVRKDFDELTYSLVTKANFQLFPRGKPRVILFIDDLDRCPPVRVVEILETVQLLLNTELFIAVLGLDTRYVTRALEKEYKEILQSEGDPSGLDYIEKIIQIPYRVRPIENDGLKNYLEGQMKVKLQGKEEAIHAPAAAQPNIAASTPQSASATKAVESAKSSTEKSEPTPEDIVPPELLEVKSIELPAAVIRFRPEDINDLNDCCQKISLSPRSIKRLVNVLKLMKIFWFRTAKSTIPIEEREPSRSAKQAAITLLALSSAYPEVMRQAFVYIENLYRQGKQNTQLFAALENVKLPPNSMTEILGQLEQYKSDLKILQKMPGIDKRHYGYITLEALSQSTFNLTRSFSFVGDSVYWSDAKEKGSRSHRPKPQAAKTRISKNGK